MPLLIIARLTLHEAARRRLILAVFLLTVVAIGLTSWGFSRLPTLRDGSTGQPLSPSELQLTVSTLLILVAYMFSVVLAAGAAFLAAPAVAADVDSGLVLALLPRPIRRADLVLGKWLGLAALLAIYAGLTGAVELTAVRAVTGFSPPFPALALVYLVGQALVLLALALLASTRLAPMTGGIIALVLFGIAWLAGIAGALGGYFHNTAITSVTTVIGLLMPTDTLWRGAVYNLEPAAVVALSRGIGQTPFAVAAPPPIGAVLWAVAWMIAMLGLAAYSFGRRDL